MNWTNGVNWVGDVAPVPGDDVVIGLADSVLSNGSIQIASLNISNAGASLTMGAGDTLEINGDLTLVGTLTGAGSSITVEGDWNSTGSFTNGGSTVNLGGVGGALIDTNGDSFAVLNIDTDAYTCSDGIAVSGALTIGSGSLTMDTAGSLTADSVTLSGGDLTVTTPATYSVTNDFTMNVAASSFSGTGTGTIGGNLAISNGTADGTGDMSVTGNVNLSGGTLEGDSRTITVGTNWNQSAGTFNAGTVTATVSLTATNPTVDAVDAFYNLTVADGVSQNTAVSVGNVLTVTGGTWTTNGNTLDVDGNLTGAGALTAGASAVALGSSMDITTFTANTSTVTFDEGTNGTVEAYSFNNVTIDKDVLADTVTMNGLWSVSGDLTINQGELITSGNGLDIEGSVLGTGGELTAGASAINIGTSMTFAGTFTAGTSTVTFDTGSAGTVNSYTFATVEISKTAEANTITAGGAWTVGTLLTLTQGTFDAGAFTHVIAGGWDSSNVNFSFTEGTSTISLTGANPGVATEGAGDPFNNLTVANGANQTTTVEVDGVLTVTGGTWTTNGNALDVEGNLTGAGGLTAGASAVTLGSSMDITTFTAGTSTVTFDSGTNGTVESYTFASVVINKDAEADTVTANGAWTVGTSLTLTQGTFIAGAFTHVIAGGWDSSNVNFSFTEGTSTISLTGANPGVATEGVGDPFNNLTVANGANQTTTVEVGGILTVTGGTWTTNGNALDVEGNLTGAGGLTAGASAVTLGSSMDITTFTAGTSTVTFDSGTNGTVESYSFATVVINKDAEADTVTANGAWSVGTLLTLTQGTFIAGAFTHSIAGGWDSSNVNFSFTEGTSTISLTGLNPGVATEGVGDPFNNLTVANGANQTTTVEVGGILTVTGGTWTTNGNALDVDGNLTGAGALTAGASAVTLGSSMDITTFTANTSTVTFDEGTNGTVEAYSFNNVTIDKDVLADTVTMNGLWSVSGDLTINQGELITSGNGLDIEGSVLGTGGELTAGASAINIGTSMTFAGTFTAGTSTVTFDTGSAGTVNSYTFATVEISKTAEANTITAGGAWTVGTLLTLTQGTFDAGAFTHVIAGGWDSSNVNFSFTEGTSTISLTGANPGVATEGAGDPFNNLTVANGANQTTTVEVDGVLTVTGGTWTTNGNALDVEGNLTGAGGLTAGASAVTLGSSMDITTFTAGTSTVTFDSGTNGTVESYTFATVVINKDAEADTVTANGAWTVGTSLTLTQGTFIAGAFTHSIAGGWDSSNVNFSFTEGTSTISLTGLNPGVATEGVGDPFNNLTVANGANQTTTVEVGGILTVTGGTWTTNNNALDVEGNLTGAGALTAGASAVTLGSSMDITTFTANTSTVTFDEGTNGTVEAYSFNIVTIDKDVLADTVTMNGLWSVSGDLTINQGELITSGNGLDIEGSVLGTGGELTAGASAINIGTSMTFAGTYTAGTSTVTFDTGSAGTVNSYTFATVEISKTAEANTITAGGAWTVGTLLTLTQGTFDAGAFTHVIAGGWDSSNVNFSFTEGTSTISLTGLNPGVATEGVGDPFNNLTVANGANQTTTVEVDGVLTVTGGTWTTNGNALDVEGNLTGAGGLTAGASAVTLGSSMDITTFTAGTSTVTFDSGTNGTVESYTFATVVINKDAEADTVTANGAWTVGTSLTLTQGTFIAGAFTHVIAGGWDSSNVNFSFTEGTSTISLTGLNPGVATEGVGDPFNNLTVANGANQTTTVEVGGILTVTGGTWTTNGNALDVEGNLTGAGGLTAGASAVTLGSSMDITTFTAGTSTVTFDSGTNGTVESYSFATVVINKDAEADTVTANGAWSVGTLLTLTQGTFVAGAFTHSIAGGWDSSSVNFSLTEGTSTISLTGANPGISTENAADSFNNLTVAIGATVNSATVTVNGTLTTGTGSLDTQANNLTIAVLDHQLGGDIDGAAGGTISVTGGASLADDITKDGGNITFNTGGTVSLTDTVVLTSAGAGNITFDVAVSGGENLTVDAGTGNLNINANLGDPVRLSAVSLSGGTINLGAVVYTDNSALTFNDPLVLTANGSLDTNVGAGAITFNNTIEQDGTAWTLDLDAGTGNIDINDTVGAGGAIGAFTIVSAGDVTTGAGDTVDADSMSITASTAVDLNGTITTDNGFSSSGTTFDNTGASITTSATAITLNHSAQVTIGSNLDSNNGTVSITSTGDSVLTTTGSVDAGNSTITVNAANHVSVSQFTTSNATATAVQISATAGNIYDYSNDTTYDIQTGVAGDITLSAGGNIDGNGAADDYLDISANLTVIASSAGASGIKIRGLGDLIVDTATATGAGGDVYIYCSGDCYVDTITANDRADITATGSILESTAAHITAVTADLDAQDGIGNITAFTAATAAAAGDPIELTVSILENASTTTAGSDILLDVNGAMTISAGSVDIADVNTGTCLIFGDDDLNASAAGSIDLSGNDNFGMVSSGGLGTAVSIPDAGLSSSGNMRLEGYEVDDLAGTNDLIIAGNTFLLTFESSTSVTLNTTILSLDAYMDTSGDLTVVESNGLTLNDVLADSGFIDVTSAGTITATSVIATNGYIDLDATAGDITATLVNTSGTNNDANDITLTTTNGTIDIVAVTGGDGNANDVTLNQGGAGESITCSGTGITGDELDITYIDSVGAAGSELLTDVDNLEASGAGDFYLIENDSVIIGGIGGTTGITITTGDIDLEAGTLVTLSENISTASDGNITFSNSTAVDLSADVSITASGSGSLVFSGLLDSGTNNNLDIDVDTGSVTFTGAVGASPLGILTINNTGNGTGVNALSTISAASVSITDGGAVDLDGAVTVPDGFSSTGNGTTFNNAAAASITTSSGAGADIIINHSGNLTLAGDLSTGAVIAGNVDIDTSGGSIDIDGSITSGTGSVDIDASASTIDLDAVISSTTGAVTIDAIGLTTVGAGGDITTTTGNVTFGGALGGTLATSGDVSTTGNGGNVIFTRATELQANVAVNTSANAGNITFSSALSTDGTAWNLNLTAGTGSIDFDNTVGTNANPLGTITINSGSGGVTADNTIDADSMSITNGGNVTMSGAVDTPSGFSSAGVDFDNTGGAITTLDSALTINHTGDVIIESDLTTNDGAVSIDGNTSISLDADITTNDGNIDINDAVTLTDIYAATPNTITISSAGAGNVDFDGTIDGTTDTDLTVSSAIGTINFDGDINGAAGMDLTVSSTGNVTFTIAAIGNSAGETIGDVSITGGSVDLYSVGNSGLSQDGCDTLDVDADTIITLTGADYITNGNQRYDVTDVAGNYIRFNLSGTGDMDSSTGDVRFGNVDLGDVYLDYNSGWTLTLLCDVYCDMFIFYGGTLDLNGQTLTTTDDFAVFGGSYDEDDADWSGADNRFDYQDRFDGTVAYDPGSYDAAFINNAGTSNIEAGSTITVGANFYVNGADLEAAGNWNLNVNSTASVPTLQYNDGTDPIVWGVPYNVAFNLDVENSQVTGGNISAAVPSVGTNNNVGNSGGNVEYVVSTTDGWDFDRPDISSAETVWDDAIYITFTEPIENSNNEISDLIGNSIMLTNNNTVDITDTFMGINSDGTSTGDSTDGDGDITSFYIRFAGTTWNTDAELLTGGGASSTDTDGNNQGVFPNLSLIKSAVYDAGGHNPIRNYNYNISAVAYQSVTDGCGPVIIDVETGQYGATVDNYDYHNYLTITYSEPVEYWDDSGVVIAGADVGSTITNDICENYVFDGLGPSYLGQIPDVDGANVDVTITGLMTYDGDVVAGSTNNEGFASGAIPSATYTSCNSTLDKPSNGYSLTINIMAYSPDGGATWDGYLGKENMDLIQPENFTGLASSNVRDEDGNNQLVTTNPITQNSGGWDVDPPGVATYTISSSVVEIIPLDEDSNSLLDRFEFHFHDDYYTSEALPWDSETMHPDTTKGVRDDSLLDIDAFTFEEAGTSPVSTYNGSFSTNISISNTTFEPAGTGISIDHDPYITILMNASAPWTTLQDMWCWYDEDIGYLTDWAGNRLRTNTNLLCVEYVPPEIELALCAPGNDWIYIRFSEPVWGDSSTTTDIDSGDLYYSGGSLSITGVTDYPGGLSNQEYILELDDELVRNDIFTGKIYVNPTSIYDADGNAYQDDIVRKISDLGLDIVEPIWASDGIHDDDISEGSTLQDFDGTGRLLDRDITLQARINASTVSDSSMRMYYDANVSSSKVVDGLWLPSYHPILAPTGNYSARYLNSDETLGNGLNNFELPASDEEMEDGNTIEFLFMIDNLPCVRMATDGDIWSYEPWSFDIDDIRKQKGGVTILNNIINPNDGDKAVLMYEIPSSGVVTAQIFSLNGSLVKILHRGRQAEGSYQYTWDGRNNGGRIVARGVYFVRVVGPDTDEIRKIMVVK